MEQEAEHSAKVKPGFHFHPTALELIVHYLQTKVLGVSYHQGIINEHVDLYRDVTPEQLKGDAIIHRNEYMYFFSQVAKKHVNGKKCSRVVVDDQGTSLGYWKASQKGAEILGANGVAIGLETRLVFYTADGRKTAWLMIEYKLADNPYHKMDREWTICKVYEGGRTSHEEDAEGILEH
ncbi:NAC domain-containing protein 46 [Daucus carota subsp. sativus]|uniref:NAC domain-containing protein 46 n=1 Tax=Daucus carota subsp. sativus TaxID=79200 RepID=UPI0007B1E349|nr:PREDICTED: NAC domain-containing protein 100-like [Daucus carota subsp. sativus]